MEIKREFMLASSCDASYDPWLQDIFAFAEREAADDGRVLKAKRKTTARNIRYLVSNWPAKLVLVLQKMRNQLIVTLQRYELPKLAQNVTPELVIVERRVFSAAPSERPIVARYLIDKLCVDTPYSLGTVERATVGASPSADRFGGRVQSIEEDGRVVTAHLANGASIELDAQKVVDVRLTAGGYLVFTKDRSDWGHVDASDFFVYFIEE